MAQVSPIIQDEILTYGGEGPPTKVEVDSSGWYAWPQTASVFTFRSGEGDFTVRKERAGNRRGEPYWRVYRKRGGKLHRAYLGKSEELTLERLGAIATGMADQHTGGSPRRGQEQPAPRLVSPRVFSSHKAHRPLPQVPSTGS